MKTVVKIESMEPEEINNFIVTALEGGINYWCGKAVIKMASTNPDEKKYYGVPDELQEKVVYASDAVGYGGTLILYDVEDPTDNWELTRAKFINGFEKYCQTQERYAEDLVDDHDADDADQIIQLAIFNEITFG
jgi:hypothetical protein